MPKHRNWKSNLLSSGVPLEFETAKILVSKGFYVDSDYTYTRRDSDASGIAKDFSIDIEANAYPPFDPKGDQVDANLRLLIDCKYRIHNTKWLFLPEISEESINYFGCDNTIPGRTIRVITEFSPYVIDNKSCYEFESKLPTCYKGLEIRLGSADQGVFDAEIKHGISQLRYAMPRLFKKMVWNMLSIHPEDNIPIIFSPILLTTADLLVAHETMSMSEIEKDDDVSEIAREVPYLILFSNYGPDFEEHCSSEFKGFGDLDNLDTVKRLEEKYRLSHEKIYEFNYPSQIGKGLAQAHLLRNYFTQFFICNYREFPNFIDEIKRAISEMIKTRRDV
jgi:hypothetical protein